VLGGEADRLGPNSVNVFGSGETQRA
jgi:hypothetical protein